MADYVGIQGKAGFALDRGLYGAGPDIEYPDDPPGATQIAAGHQVPFSSETFTKSYERVKDDALVGAGAHSPSQVATAAVAGNIEGPLRWRGWERLKYCALGFEQPDNSPATLAVGAYAHLFELDDLLQDQAWVAGTERLAGFNAGDRKVRRGALGIFKGGTSHVFSSVMIDKMTVTGNPTEVRVSFDGIGYDYASGAYNYANWTLPGATTAMSLFQQATVKLGTRAAGYGSLATYCPSSWELSVTRGLKGDDRTTCSAPYIVQPECSAWREVTLKLEFPRFNPAAVTLMGYQDLGTELAGFVELVGPQIGATGHNYLWGFYLSSLYITEHTPANVGGPEVLTYSCTMQAHRPVTADFFVGSGKHAAIPLVKGGELVAVTNNEDAADYSTEV